MKNNLFDLSGRVALVAGGSSGLGLQFAKAMANAGADVAIVARRTDKLEENAKQISDEYGVEVYPHYIDLRDAASVTACVEDVVKHFGKIDILVNAGGVGGSGDPATLTDEQWYYVSRKHVWTAPYCAAKGGVQMMTKALANDWGKYDITVNCIAPGYFPSELTAAYIDSDAFTQLHKDRCPKSRHGLTGEMDGLCVYFASTCCSYTTGQTVAVDGGWTCT